jgi:hypothetical protein
MYVYVPDKVANDPGGTRRKSDNFGLLATDQDARFGNVTTATRSAVFAGVIVFTIARAALEESCRRGQFVLSKTFQNRVVAAIPLHPVTSQPEPLWSVARLGPAVAPPSTLPAGDTRSIAVAKLGRPTAKTAT